MPVPGLGDATASFLAPTGPLARNEPHEGHELIGVLEALEVREISATRMTAESVSMPRRQRSFATGVLKGSCSAAAARSWSSALSRASVPSSRARYSVKTVCAVAFSNVCFRSQAQWAIDQFFWPPVKLCP